VNAAAQPAELELPAPGSAFIDLLNDGAQFQADGGRLRLDVPSCWARVLAHHSGQSG
jgi:hypothetical protein